MKLGNLGDDPGGAAARWCVLSVIFIRGRAMSNTAVHQNKWADKRIFTTGEAAEICKVSQQTIIRCFDSGRLGGFRVPGSKFRRIPRGELMKFMLGNEIPTDVLEAVATRRVLVVDDDPAIVELFQDLLSRDGRWLVKAAATGYEAGMMTESFRPQVIVLDYMLPDINGNIVCKKIRENPEFADTKIIVVSGVVNQTEIDELMKAGADDFVKKPFNIQQLLAKMQSMLGG